VLRDLAENGRDDDHEKLLKLAGDLDLLPADVLVRNVPFTGLSMSTIYGMVNGRN